MDKTFRRIFYGLGEMITSRLNKETNLVHLNAVRTTLWVMFI